ncbi:MAG TPA: GGDEF domain-containing protein [Egibacteraceae bacterium]|nr:GGDEF domain-containing protein [Egibacteraceae bacterium]
MSTDGPRLPLRLVGRPDVHRAASAYLDAGLDMAYQPIVHLGTGSVLAYEALARPRHSEAGGPQEFFAALEEAGMRLDGERAAFDAAMQGLLTGEDAFPRVKLFVNASPTTLMDAAFDVQEFVALAERAGLAPSDLVVEVTESEAIDDLESLARRAERLRHLGVALAVDDAGAGHASFRVITRLRPAYIKIDRDLVREVDQDGARHAFIEAMVRFSREIGSRLIAEGIETEAELASLAGLGVEAGQGWFLARPAIGVWEAPTPDSRRVIALAAQRPRLGGAQVTVGHLATPALVLEPGATLAQAHARFAAEPTAGLLVATDHNRVVAQLSRRAVDRVAAAGSWEHVAHRPATEFADHQARTVQSELDVVEVGTILAARERDDLIEDVVVTDALGRLVGVVSLRDVLRSLADVRKRAERDLNPLSGLSGPGWLEAELERRLLAEDALVALWVDLDGFRRINDSGGFALGDDVLRVMGQALRGVCAGVPGAEPFHAGADDFVVLVPPSRYEETLSELVRSFEHEVLPFVRTELRLRAAGGVVAVVALSMAAVDLVGRPPPGHRHMQWVQDQLAGLIPLSKGQPGHCCVRRGGDQLHVTTWSPDPCDLREVDVGEADPGVVLGALALAERSWAGWLSENGGNRFPGPRAELQSLHERYLRPVRRLAERALATGTTVELRVTGHEDELLELLDRLSLVVRRAHLAQRAPTPPELALLDRLVRFRARRLQRTDRLDRGALAQTPPRRRTSSIAP